MFQAALRCSIEKYKFQCESQIVSFTVKVRFRHFPTREIFTTEKYKHTHKCTHIHTHTTHTHTHTHTHFGLFLVAEYKTNKSHFVLYRIYGYSKQKTHFS